MQNDCRRRASRKLAATLSLSPDFEFPTSLSVEQSTSDDVAELHAELIPPGAAVVDLTCGLGIDTFHTARRAASVTAVDIDPRIADCALRNAALLSLNNVTVICADSARWIAELPESAHFDVAFIDPARRGASGQRVFGLADCSPDVLAMLPDIKRHTGRLIIKASPMLDIAKVLSELPNAVEVRAIGTLSECKELLIIVDFAAPAATPATIRANTLSHGEFTYIHGTTPPPQLADRLPQPGDIIGEPYPAVMKITPRGALSGAQLHPNTHIYLNPDTPWHGRLYRVHRVEPFSSSNLRTLAKEGIEASVAVRNIPISADDLRRRLRARESATQRLLATTALTSRIILFLHPIA